MTAGGQIRGRKREKIVFTFSNSISHLSEHNNLYRDGLLLLRVTVKGQQCCFLSMWVNTIRVVTSFDSDRVNRVIWVDACTAGGGGAYLPVTRLC